MSQTLPFSGTRPWWWGWLLPLVVVLGAAGCNLPRSQAPSPPPSGSVTAAPTPLTVSPAPSLAPSVTPHPASAAETPQPTAPGPTQRATPCNMAAAAPRVDITIPDGTVLHPGQAFTKIWRLVNAGTCPWTPDYAVVWFSGPRLGAPAVIPLEATVLPGQTVDIAVEMVAPTTPGTYTSYWKLRDPQGHLFGIGAGDGSPFWVSIVVQAEASPTVTWTPTATLTATATFTATATATAPTPTSSPTASATPLVEVQGDLTLTPEAQVDLDTLTTTGEGLDLGYSLDTEGAHWLKPLNGALLGVYGLSEPSLQACAEASKAAVAVALEPLSQGTYLCYQTDAGRLGRLRYLDLSADTLTLEALTWALGP